MRNHSPSCTNRMANRCPRIARTHPASKRQIKRGVSVRKNLIRSGALGQEKTRVNVKCAILLVTGLAALSSCALGRSANYVGALANQQGYCGTAEDSHGITSATLSIRGRSVQFEPESGVISLNGQIDSAGHVLAQSNMPGADHKPFLQVFEGNLTGHLVTGRFATPRCRATVTLKRQ